jgi:murein DD-endopeptidase
MTRSAIIPVLLFTGLLSACGAMRPLPASMETSPSRILRAPPGAAKDLSATGYQQDLPDELFEHSEAALPPQFSIAPSEVNLPANERVLAIARQFVGIPYRMGGASPAGFDCSGLVYYSFRQAGITVPRTSASQHQAARPISLDELRSGDLLFFKIKPQRVSHVGIFVKDDLFLHAASTGKNVTYSRLGEPYWKKRLAGAGRFVAD